MQFEECGFHIESSLFEATELTFVQSAVTRAPRSRAGSRHLLALAPVARLARDRRLLDLASACLGAMAVPFTATFFDKSPQSNWLVSWHQDLALPLRHQVEAPGWGPWTRKGGQLYALAPADVLLQIVALRVHLDDSTEMNGPLRVLPGTHRAGRLTDDEITEAARTVGAVECVAPVGGVVAMRPLVVHASSKASSDASRRVLHFEYATSLTLDAGVELAVG